MFHDISGSGIQIGLFSDPLTTTDHNNTINNTIVKKAAAEFSGAVGINVGYTIGTTITHNDVHDLTYAAISVGWGWSGAGATDIAGWATIAYNKVHDYKQTLNDGGGIYMLGKQNGSQIFRNHVYDKSLCCHYSFAVTDCVSLRLCASLILT